MTQRSRVSRLPPSGSQRRNPAEVEILTVPVSLLQSSLENCCRQRWFAMLRPLATPLLSELGSVRTWSARGVRSRACRWRRRRRSGPRYRCHRQSGVLDGGHAATRRIPTLPGPARSITHGAGRHPVGPPSDKRADSPAALPGGEGASTEQSAPDGLRPVRPHAGICLGIPNVGDARKSATALSSPRH